MTDYFYKYTPKKVIDRMTVYRNIGHMLEERSNEYGNAIAFCDSYSSITFYSLKENVANARAILFKAGIKKGDRVGLLAENSIEFVKYFLAITSYGAMALILPVHLDNDTLKSHYIKYKLKAFVCTQSLLEKLNNTNANIITTDTECNEQHSWEDCDSNDDCCAVFTGGTAGKRKAAILSHKAVLSGTRNGCYGVEDAFDQRYFLVLPMTHVFGLIRNMLYCIYTGSTLYICSNIKNMFREMATYKPTAIVLVPGLADMALSLSKQFGRNMFGSSLKYVICGSAIVPPYLIEQYNNLGIRMYPGYGFTESANLVCGNPEAIDNPSSVGHAYPDIQVKVKDNELLVKGPNITSGYLEEESETKKAFDDNWFKTGDLGRIDSDGSIFLLGKKTDIINLSNGEKVFPLELESYFYKINAIKDCLVYEKNEKLVLEVFPRSGEYKLSDSSDKYFYLKEIINEWNNKLPSFERINSIIVREEDFERNSSFRIIRK